MIIIANGPPASGKDAIADYLESHFHFHKMAFKDQLFLDTYEFFGVSKEWFDSKYTQEFKNVPSDKLNGLSRRQALIHVSENIMKPLHGNTYYGDITAKNLPVNRDVVFSDSGFIEEAQPVINKFERQTKIIFLQLFRDGCDYKKDSRKYLRSSNVIQEIVLGNKTVVDDNEFFNEQEINVSCIQIHNNSSLEEFFSIIEKIIKEETNEKETNHTNKYI